jgi:WD40 repeat protein
MAVTHKTAGRMVEYRKANARALAVAERTRDANAMPMVHLGHGDEVHAVAVHPTRPIVAAGSLDGTVILWDLTSGRPALTLRGELYSFVTSVAFSPDGSLVAAAGADVNVWDAATGAPVHTFSGQGAVAFSPDGTLLAAGGLERAVDIWNVATGAPVRSFTDHVTKALAFSPDGTHLASAGAGTRSGPPAVELWDVGTGSPVRTLPLAQDARTLEFSADGAQLAAAGLGATTTLWDVTTGDVIATPAGSIAAAFSPDGTHLASSSFSGQVTISNLESGEERVLAPHPSALSGVAAVAMALSFSADGARLVTGHSDRTVRIWNMDTGEEANTITTLGAEVSAVGVNRDATRIAAARRDNTIVVWNSGPTYDAAHHEMANYSTAVAPGLAAVSSGQVGKSALWSPGSTSEPRVLAGHRGPILVQAFSDDGSRLATVGDFDRTIKVWDTAAAAELHALKGHTTLISAVAFSPDGSRLVSADMDATLRLWDADSGAELGVFSGKTRSITCLAFHPDGNTVASAGFGTLALWDISKGEVVSQQSDPAVANGMMRDVRFSPDGVLLAAASEDGRVTMWNTTTGARVHQLVGHSGPVKTIAFSADGSLLVSGSDDKLVTVWNVATGTRAVTVFDTGTAGIILSGADNRVDGTPGEDGGQSLLYWQIADVQLPGFVGWQRYHTPGLLAEVLEK